MENTHKYPFFPHRECPHFPCHTGIDESEFNCLFCYCPLYALGPNCGGNYRYNAKGYKDCKQCARPHNGDAGTLMVKEKFSLIADLARRNDETAGNR